METQESHPFPPTPSAGVVGRMAQRSVCWPREMPRRGELNPDRCAAAEGVR